MLKVLTVFLRGSWFLAYDSWGRVLGLCSWSLFLVSGSWSPGSLPVTGLCSWCLVSVPGIWFIVPGFTPCHWFLFLVSGLCSWVLTTDSWSMVPGICSLSLLPDSWFRASDVLQGEAQRQTRAVCWMRRRARRPGESMFCWRTDEDMATLTADPEPH